MNLDFAASKRLMLQRHRSRLDYEQPIVSESSQTQMNMLELVTEERKSQSKMKSVDNFKFDEKKLKMTEEKEKRIVEINFRQQTNLD